MKKRSASAKSISPAAQDAASRRAADPHVLLAALDEHMAAGAWARVVAASGNLINRLPPESPDAAELFLRRGMALFELKANAQAKPDLQRAWASVHLRHRASLELLHIFRQLALWQEVLEMADVLIAQSPDSAELSLERANALRFLGAQDLALRELARNQILSDRGGAGPWSPAALEFARLKASLLCDSGDFEGALEILIPPTAEIKVASAPEEAGLLHQLLTLRGWAHQNCREVAQAREAEGIYRRALAMDAEDCWSRKGLGNALRRQGRTEEANEAYNIVIRDAEERGAAGELDAYDACLAGWCLYCIGRFKEAADLYAGGLASVGVGAAAQFDYALILLADLSFGAAQDQYEESIAEIKSKNVLRRCGLLYVALLDLREAMKMYPALGQANESYLIQASMAKALEDTVRNFTDEWSFLAARMLSFLESSQKDNESVEASLAAMLAESADQVDWGWFELYGIAPPCDTPPCAVLMPLIRHKRAPDRVFTIAESGALLAAEAGAFGGGTMVRLATKAPVSPGTRIVSVSAPMLQVVGEDILTTDLTAAIQWQEIAAPASCWVGVTLLETADAVLDQWATRLTARSVQLLVEASKGARAAKKPGGSSPAGEAERQLAAGIAAFAVAAASKPDLLHQALLAYGAADGDVSESSLRKLQPRLPEHLPTNPETFLQSVRIFRNFLELQATAPEVPPSPEGAEVPKWMASKSGMIRRIFEQAYEISRIEDKDLQYRRAEEAAKVMQLLVPLSEELQQVDATLKESLNSQAEFYLDDDVSILLMSRSPAFYATKVLPSMTRPAIQSFAFLKATREMQRTEVDRTAEAV